jgi:hypothetical protein
VVCIVINTTVFIQKQERLMMGLGKVIPPLNQPDDKRALFGFGKQVDEEKCDSINVFMRCFGIVRREMQHRSLPPHTTIAEAKETFGRPMRQGVVRVEGSFAIDQQDIHKPIAAFSKGCQLNLDFTDEHQGRELLFEGAENALRKVQRLTHL